LGRTIARFKTLTLRELEDSNPYFHNGSTLRLGDVIQFYVTSSQLARENLLRNPPQEFRNMSINQEDIDALRAFLRALTEDYDDT
jgi:cytochrome c peroxidase